MTDETVAYMGWPLSAQEQIDGFRREVRELKAENALLWEQGALLFDKTLELGTENAKLRELCENMLSCIEIRAAFNRPPTTKMYEEFAQQARELGLEVD